MPQTDKSRSKDTGPFTVVRDDGPEAAKLRGAVVAIGNFDGVHRGHRSVIDLAMTRAVAAGKPSAVLTLEPHPRSYFRPDEKLFRLTDARQKLRLLAATGLDGAVVLTFDAALAGLPAEQFVSQILVGRLGVSGVAIGFDFHFGQGRGGSPAFLKDAGARYGFPVDVAPKLEDEGRPVSSGTIRAALEAGRVVEAAELLGYPWFATGEVIHGEKRGRELGFPTANLQARSGLRAQARHLCRPGRHRGGSLRRGRELRPAAHLRQWGAAAGGVPVRFFRRSLRAGHGCGADRLDPAGGEIRLGRGADGADEPRFDPGA